DAVWSERLKSFARVHQGFAFFNTGSGGVDHRSMRAQQFGGKFKRHPGTRGRLIEEERDAFPVQQRARTAGVHFSRQLENGGDLAWTETFQVKQRTGAGHTGYDTRSTSTTCSC